MRMRKRSYDRMFHAARRDDIEQALHVFVAESLTSPLPISQMR
jgi:hypothetical protein